MKKKKKMHRACYHFDTEIKWLKLEWFITNQIQDKKLINSFVHWIPLVETTFVFLNCNSDVEKFLKKCPELFLPRLYWILFMLLIKWNKVDFTTNAIYLKKLSYSFVHSISLVEKTFLFFNCNSDLEKFCLYFV